MKIRKKLKKTELIVSSILLCMTNIICGSQPSDSLNISSIAQLTPQDAYKFIEDTSVSVLDVRTTDEYKISHIKGAVMIPVQELEKRISEIDHLKNKKVLVYCRTGNRSKKALQILQQNGFTQLYHLEKGIKLWMQEGFKVE